ncbi:VOC family protein [Paenalkalicoccus suaedae]|uniref:VOC family protein n=1 Tax=Paenalkalicoccus suaedae TaxID=2592382 RepID=A0A859FJC7_9BACI|nr:VOC family protein [Paenalkalicoccus suaedae]QKS72765.1 VOC family protein [Paenalkalicoccus suaedae]
MHINRLMLCTDKLTEMKDFYVKKLGFALIDESMNGFKIAVGSSELEFAFDDAVSHPHYHVAFNIPSNKFNEAKEWAKARVSLNVENGQDEAYFDFFSAHALYFSDPSGNVIELISRHEINAVQEEPFSMQSFLNISEIGVTVHDVARAADELNSIGISKMNNGLIDRTSINFMGEKNEGVFIILNQPGRRWIFSDKISNAFPLSMTLSTKDVIEVDTGGVLRTIR